MTSQEEITLNFHGPFKFVNGDKYLYDTEFVESEGIYIWTIKDTENGINYVHYIGETVQFGKRHRQHLIRLAGLDYRIINPDAARRGIENIVWDGLWRDKSQDAVGMLLERYDEVSKKVTDYISLINIYFAPTSFETLFRKHVEGCLGWNLRRKYPHFKKFYPDDNHIGTSKRLGQSLVVNLPEDIAGIDKEQTI